MTTTTHQPTYCPHNDGYEGEALCLNCGAAWCSICDPGPAALCHYCHGRGYSTAEITAPTRPTTNTAERITATFTVQAIDPHYTDETPNAQAMLDYLAEEISAAIERADLAHRWIITTN